MKTNIYKLSCILIIYLALSDFITLGQTHRLTTDRNELLFNQLASLPENGAISPDSAVKFIVRVYKDALLTQSDSLQFQCKLSLSEIYGKTENELLSIDMSFDALKKLDEFPGLFPPKVITHYKVRLFIQLGYNYYRLKMNILATTYFKKAIIMIDDANRFNQETFDKSTLLQIFYNAGSIVTLIGDNEYANYLTNNGLKLNRIVGDSIMEARLFIIKGSIYKNMKDLDSAGYYYDKAFEILLVKKGDSILPHLLNNYGKHFALKGDTLRSLEFYNQAFTIGRSAGVNQSILIAAEELGKLYAWKKDYLQAYKFSNIARNLTDSLFYSVKIPLRTNREIMYNALKEIRQMEFDYEKSRATHKHFALILVGVILLVSVIILLIFFLFMSRSKNRQLKQLNYNQLDKNPLDSNMKTIIENEIEFKSRVLISNILQLANQFELIQHLDDQLMRALNDQSEEKQNKIAEILGDFKRNMSNNKWKEFDLRFQEVFPEYVNLLKTRFPDLSASDLRIAVLLRLNLSSKEMASITMRTADSIKISRSRLRKKLGLSSDENLVSYLHQEYTVK